MTVKSMYLIKKFMRRRRNGQSRIHMDLSRHYIDIVLMIIGIRKAGVSSCVPWLTYSVSGYRIHGLRKCLRLVRQLRNIITCFLQRMLNGI